MNINYNILWIDDSDDYVESAIELVKQTVENNHMIPNIKVYGSFDELKEKELENFDLDTFNTYDQILVDFALSGSTGDEIIRDIRGRKIFTDIVFYSSNYQSMIDDVKNKGQLDGVFFAKRENLTSAIDNVVKKNLKREYSIANIRGIIMDGTSEFDYICRNVAVCMFEKLEETKQTEIFEKACLFVKNAEDKSKQNFEDLAGATKNAKKYLKDLMFSVDYVIDNKDRYELLALIVKNFDFGEPFNETFAQAYYESLIKPRNDLAHNKLYYGNCKKKLHVAKKKRVHACEKGCEQCESKYDVEKCEIIRGHIYNYFLMLTKLGQDVNNVK